MPRLLKKDCIRLAEASIEFLALAQLGISSFHRLEHKETIVRYAPETGLIGSSIELIMSAVLVQAFDKKVVIKNGLRYKTAVEILADFRALLKQRSANITFLTNGVNNGDDHLNKLLELTNRFRVVIIARANGLHNGIGLNFDILSVLFQEVSSFICLIAESNNFKPYIPQIPKLIVLTKEKQLIIDEIYRKIQEEQNLERQINNVASLFLLLPEVPNELPDWLSNFERLNVAPRENDIVNLINSLEVANPVTLRKVRNGQNVLPVRIENNNPDAIPIQPQYLRGQFNQFRDQFFSDAATANGRLENRHLDLPPTISICRLFCQGFTNLKIVDENLTELTAHQSWPNIASALKVPSNGITFPVWYMVRKTSDLGQLKAILIRSKEYGNDPYKRNIDHVIHGIDCLIKNDPIDDSRLFYLSSLKNFQDIKENYARFNLSSSKKEYDLSEKYFRQLQDFENGEVTIYELGNIILSDNDLENNCKRYWMTKIVKSSYELESLPFLFSLYESDDYSVCRTEIKKTFKSIDLVTFGPRVEVENTQNTAYIP
ncbi:MAG: hypothetical protein H6566_25845 [Lewinellaceae bacterium]|nr:hypothetical protein [Lewinellaceae bacterium]